MADGTLGALKQGILNWRRIAGEGTLVLKEYPEICAGGSTGAGTPEACMGGWSLFYL